jgi:carboxyl-terminal processing protease
LRSFLLAPTRHLPTYAVLAAITLSVLARSAGASPRDFQSATRQGAHLAADTGSRSLALDSTLAVATFDSVWRTVGSSLDGRGVTRLDWPAVRRELLPRAARARSDAELRAIISDLLGRLGESHFAILPAPDAAPATTGARAEDGALGTAGIVVRVVGRHLVVWRTDSAGAARRSGVVPGWTVERIDDFAAPSLGPADSVGPRRLGAVMGAMAALRGVPGAPVRLTARDPAGVRHVVSFPRDTLHGPFARFGNLPPLPASLDFVRQTLADGRCIGVIRFDYWMPPVMPALDSAVEASRRCAGIVLDLRGNLGGIAGMMMGAAGHFLNEPRTLGTMRTRGEEMRFAANPRRVTGAGVAVEPFAGSLAILVDGLSASTSEMFAAGLQALGRARVFGERSAGQALPAIATKLPTGDVLMHVVADFVAADGSRIEGRGVTPDALVPLTIADVQARRDAPMDAAVRWIERARPAVH